MSKFQSATDEINYYQDLWDQAQKNIELQSQFDVPAPQETEISGVEKVEYLNESSHRNLDLRDMLILSDDIDRVFHPELYRESKDAEVGRRSDVAAKSPNPIEITSVGKDQDVVVTKDVTDGPVLRELSEIRIKLEALERRVHAAYIQGNQKQENSLTKEATNLRSRIEELCEKLTSNKITNPY